MLSRKVKLQLNKKQLSELKELSSKSAEIYNNLLQVNFDRLDAGQRMLTAFDMDRLCKDINLAPNIGTDVIQEITKRVDRVFKRWQESQQTKLKFWLQHGEAYLKPLKAYLAKAGKKLWGKPRFKTKGISIQFPLRKTDQKRVKVFGNQTSVNVPLVGNLNSKFLFSGRLARSASDAAHSQFLSILAYKAANAGKTIKIVNEAYTSQICYRCKRRQKMELSEREYHCPCGYSNNRDVNAALNILSIGRETTASSSEQSLRL